jgi:hypothetical protein
MQGTVVMLMALSGLGCHNKSCDAIYAPPTYGCFGGGCYANVYPSYTSPQSFTGCYTGGYSGCYATYYGGDGGCFGGGCYGGGYSCYSSCYGGGYRSGHHGCGLLSKLFGCCGRKHFGYYNSSYYDSTYGYDSPYSPPIFGYALQYNYGGVAPGQVQSSVDMTPSEAATPVPATPVPTDSPPPPPVTEPSATPAAPTPAAPSETTLPPSTTTPPVPQEPTLTPPGQVVPSIPKAVTPPKPSI